MELKYSTQIDSAKIKAAADLNKIILTNENKSLESAQQASQNLQQEIKKINEQPGTGKVKSGDIPIKQG